MSAFGQIAITGLAVSIERGQEKDSFEELCE
jgi:hypothetical protein